MFNNFVNSPPLSQITSVLPDSFYWFFLSFRKKLASTAQYIYQALFQEGKTSDITVEALGEEFHLHKIYLCQSPYFASMFGGSWLEATKNHIYIDVVDPLITNECKYSVLTLYQNVKQT